MLVSKATKPQDVVPALTPKNILLVAGLYASKLVHKKTHTK
jgi:hypothetical protein